MTPLQRSYEMTPLLAKKREQITPARYLYLKATSNRATALRNRWHPSVPETTQGWFWEQFAHPTVDLTPFPPGSFYIEISFTLAKPYLSKDDNEFYIVDNPIQREKVFRWPMVRSTSWKGALRAAMRRLGEMDTQAEKRLFGETRDDDTGFRGNLYFFSSFFSEAGLEVINPHDRESGAGTLPILFESVPIGATSTFALLYIPLDACCSPKGTAAQAIQDLALVTSGIRAMLLVYGFGAKTSSGYGAAEDKLPQKGKLQKRLSHNILPIYITRLSQLTPALAKIPGGGK